MQQVLLNEATNEIHFVEVSDMRTFARILREQTGLPLAVQYMCDLCGSDLARIVDYIRGQKIHTCLACSRHVEKQLTN